jgi:hypothetical protein
VQPIVVGDDSVTKPIIIAYYTLGTSYEAEIDKLKQSLLQHNLEFDIEGLPNLGTWDANTKYKPNFILRMLRKHRRPVFYLDADSIMCKYPHEFFSIDPETDFGCCYFHWHGRKRELSSAVLYFSGSEISKQILFRWLEKCRDVPKIFDQYLLQDVIENWPPHTAKFYTFPEEYDVIFDLHKGVRDPVIKQMQASRRLKTEVAQDDKRETHEAMLKGMYEGQKSIILGKGESLNELGNIDRSKYVVMGINNVFKLYPDQDLLFYFDSITYSEDRQGFDEMMKRGTQIWTTFPSVAKGHYKVRFEENPYGFELGKFHHSYTSAYFCLQMMVWAGCKEIYLAGIDLNLPSTGGSYYDGSEAREGAHFFRHLTKMRPGFEIAARHQEALGFRVYRTSKLSTLDMFDVRAPE